MGDGKVRSAIAMVIHILLVDDSPSDVELTIEAMREGKFENEISVVADGVDALAFLRKEGLYSEAARPDLVLLDLNLPRKGGREVLCEMRAEPDLKRIPVAVLTTSTGESDVLRSYDLGANCYITKPVGFENFVQTVRAIEDFWLTIVRLPPR